MRQYHLKLDECDHSDELVIPTPEGPHYAKVLCRSCRKFLRWAASPEAMERREAIKSRLEQMEAIGVSSWEQGFLATIRKQGFKLSPKQQAVFDGMWKRFQK